MLAEVIYFEVRMTLLGSGQPVRGIEAARVHQHLPCYQLIVAGDVEVPRGVSMQLPHLHQETLILIARCSCSSVGGAYACVCTMAAGIGSMMLGFRFPIGQCLEEHGMAVPQHRLQQLLQLDSDGSELGRCHRVVHQQAQPPQRSGLAVLVAVESRSVRPQTVLAADGELHAVSVVRVEVQPGHGGGILGLLPAGNHRVRESQLVEVGYQRGVQLDGQGEAA